MLHGDITSCEDAPKNYDESERTGTLEIFPEYQDGLDGLVAGQTIVVLFWLHKSDRDAFEIYQRGGKSRERRGVLSTRSPARPYPITISEMKIISVVDNHLAMSGLDILDGTPIIDTKKKISLKVMTNYL